MSDFCYQSSCRTSYEDQFTKFNNSLKNFGFDAHRKMNMYCVIAAILHLGNITFEENYSIESCFISDTAEESIDIAASLLKIDAPVLRETLLNRSITTKNNGDISKLVYVLRNQKNILIISTLYLYTRIYLYTIMMALLFSVPLSKAAAKKTRDTIVKMIYSNLFYQIVLEINKTNAYDLCTPHIAVLDIPGFGECKF